MTTAKTETILPHDLPRALERAPQGIKILSLDCFDTLLWRDCHAPTDIFAALSRVNTAQRVVAETFARKAEGTLRGRSEVSLKAIYKQALPNAGEAEIESALSEELDAEARSCFAFAPTVELMRAAKASGMTIIIVSDTYLNADQLRTLIARAAGEDVAALIDRVFASSDAGVSKSQGLLVKAIKAMKCRPHEVFHIGDNKTADCDSARAIGVPALYLRQFSEDAKRRLRLERASQQLIGDARNNVRGLMPHRAILAEHEPQVSDAAEALGMAVLGPIFTAFDHWLRREADTLAQQHGGKVHWLFMLRDGHLPHLVHQAGGETDSTARVEISRFVAIAASLTSAEAYQKHFALEYGLNPSTLARQMLFDEGEIDRIVGNPATDAERVTASKKLLAELNKGQRQKITRRRARARAERLIAHIRASVNPQPGDTLMLVDLGYNGSAQDRIDALLSEAFDVQVAGRYLLLREMAATGLDKKGLCDTRHFDAELLEALCSNVAVIEQLATCEMGSVADFTDDGEPIRKASAVKGRQSAVRDRVQEGVARFARAARRAPIVRADSADDERSWREAASAALTRFMFLPQSDELDVLKCFEHDVNLGSERMVPLFDPKHARDGMRRRGLFYMKGSARMYLPAELAQEGIDTRLSSMAQKRFGLGLSYTDGAPEGLPIPAFFLSAQNSAQMLIHAQPTHDGYFAARLPIAEGSSGVALQVGALFEWLELASITISPVSALSGGAVNDARPRDCSAQFDGITCHSGGILECTDPAAFVLVTPPRSHNGIGPQMIEIVMRPLRHRASVAKATRPQEIARKDKAA